MDFENIMPGDIPYIKEFIPYVKNEEAKKFLKGKRDNL